ncbi:AEC family transporter [Alloiococcus sp. CFN-8]|uniref:AEC family transporter n=1 Tax=Alloiococcus sp. CFN-8 TaxID=3416081 RepID=UPI003CF35203
MNENMIFNEMFVLFILMLLGFCAFKWKLLDLEMNRKLSRLILTVTSPALILASVSQGNSDDKARVYYILLIAVLMYLLLPLIAIILNKVLFIPKNEDKLYRFMTVFSNIGFMGFPVIASIYGDEAIFYASIFNLMFNICLYSYGVYIMNSKKEKKVKMDLKLLLNPGIIAATAALIIFLTNIPIPYAFSRSLSLVGNITTPMAMMIIGSTLGSMPIRNIFNDSRVYLYTFVRQLVLPLITWLLLKNFITDPFVLGLSVIISAMPVGITAVMFSNEYGQDAELAARGVFITTLASFITIPIITILF